MMLFVISFIFLVLVRNQGHLDVGDRRTHRITELCHILKIKAFLKNKNPGTLVAFLNKLEILALLGSEAFVR